MRTFAMRGTPPPKFCSKFGQIPTSKSFADSVARKVPPLSDWKPPVAGNPSQSVVCPRLLVQIPRLKLEHVYSWTTFTPQTVGHATQATSAGRFTELPSSFFHVFSIAEPTSVRRRPLLPPHRNFATCISANERSWHRVGREVVSYTLLKFSFLFPSHARTPITRLFLAHLWGDLA